MKLTRREMLLAGVGALIAGCSAAPSSVASRRPSPVWPTVATPPSADRVVAYKPAPAPPVAAAASGPLPHAVARARWARSGPVMARVNPMNGVKRITVHHEGSTIFTRTDFAATAARVEGIRHYHVSERRFGDIGYHYIVDRAGTVWAGRDVRYQGAHVSEQNEHNVGVMCLGNFNKQSPTDAQLTALRATVAALAGYYNVPRNRIYTHRELGPTSCPGSSLQPRVASMRASGQLA